MSFWLLWQENTYLYVELALDPKDDTPESQPPPKKRMGLIAVFIKDSARPYG